MKNGGLSRRSQILCAAEAAFLLKGYGKTHLRDIANSVGISVPALYKYYPDKATLIANVCIRLWRDHTSDHEVVNGSSSTKSVQEVIEVCSKFAGKFPAAYQFMFSDTTWVNTADVGREIEVEFEGIRSAICSGVAAANVGVLSDADSSKLLWATFHGLTMTRICGLTSSNGCPDDDFASWTALSHLLVAPLA